MISKAFDDDVSVELPETSSETLTCKGLVGRLLVKLQERIEAQYNTKKDWLTNPRQVLSPPHQESLTHRTPQTKFDAYFTQNKLQTILYVSVVIP